MWHLCLDDGKFTWTNNEFDPYSLDINSDFSYYYNYNNCFICEYDKFIYDQKDISKDPFAERKQTNKEKSEEDILQSFAGFAKSLVKKEIKNKIKNESLVLSKPDYEVKLTVYTSRIDTIDKDRLDITLKSSKGYARSFAPSSTLFSKVKKSEIDFDTYRKLYINEMKQSYMINSGAWCLLLMSERLVLTCYCLDSENCHRTILAKDILPLYGAKYGGELSKDNSTIEIDEKSVKKFKTKNSKNSGQGNLF